jgi:hypothetical protein
MSIIKQKRAFSPNRGGSAGCGGGYEPTDPDYNDTRLAKLKADYDACPTEWKETFLDGLSRFERNQLTGRIG